MTVQVRARLQEVHCVLERTVLEQGLRTTTPLVGVLQLVAKHERRLEKVRALHPGEQPGADHAKQRLLLAQAEVRESSALQQTIRQFLGLLLGSEEAFAEAHHHRLKVFVAALLRQKEIQHFRKRFGERTLALNQLLQLLALALHLLVAIKQAQRADPHSALQRAAWLRQEVVEELRSDAIAFLRHFLERVFELLQGLVALLPAVRVVSLEDPLKQRTADLGAHLV